MLASDEEYADEPRAHGSRSWLVAALLIIATYATAWPILLYNNYKEYAVYWMVATKHVRDKCDYVHTTACTLPENYHRFDCHEASTLCARWAARVAWDMYTDHVAPWRRNEYTQLAAAVCIVALGAAWVALRHVTIVKLGTAQSGLPLGYAGPASVRAQKKRID